MERGGTGSMWQNSRIENLTEAGNGFSECRQRGFMTVRPQTLFSHSQVFFIFKNLLFRRKFVIMSYTITVFLSLISSIFPSFFRFIHAKVSPVFISIRALPYICVYLNPWFSFAVPKIRSIVSFLWEYNSFIPSVHLNSSARSIYSSQICCVTTFTWFLLLVH